MTTVLTLGELVPTPGALDAVGRAGQGPWGFVARHQRGDWGELVPEGRHELALRTGERLLSAYRTARGERSCPRGVLKEGAMRCVSGLHEWIDPDAAGRCCNGWRRALYTAPPYLARCDLVVNENGLTYGFAWERQTLLEWAESEGLRYQLGAPTILRCVGLEREGSQWVAVLKSFASDWPPKCVPVPEAVIVDAEGSMFIVSGRQTAEVSHER